MQITQKITPFLSFNSEAEEAANFYVSLMPDSRIVRVVRSPGTDAVMTVEFELAGLNFVALNVGQPWEFTHAFSLSVACETQDEIDTLWNKLTEEGKEVHCGWLTDRFGMSWQIVPANVGQWISDPDTAKAGRVMEALLRMTKLDMAKLQSAYDDE
jgi:predicted 3-demethylubiquinone-9 3-methyltransferase (glyoxalase superfamily)